MKKYFLLSLIFLSYIIFTNLLSSTLVFQTFYRPQKAEESGTKIEIVAGHSLTVIVKRARMFFGLLPTWVWLGEEEIYIKTYNHLFLATFLVCLVILILHDVFLRKRLLL